MYHIDFTLPGDLRTVCVDKMNLFGNSDDLNISRFDVENQDFLLQAPLLETTVSEYKEKLRLRIDAEAKQGLAIAQVSSSQTLSFQYLTQQCRPFSCRRSRQVILLSQPTMSMKWREQNLK